MEAIDEYVFPTRRYNATDAQAAALAEANERADERINALEVHLSESQKECREWEEQAGLEEDAKLAALDEIDTLAARLAEVERERDEWKSYKDRVEVSERERDTDRARLHASDDLAVKNAIERDAYKESVQGAGVVIQRIKAERDAALIRADAAEQALAEIKHEYHNCNWLLCLARDEHDADLLAAAQAEGKILTSEPSISDPQIPEIPVIFGGDDIGRVYLNREHPENGGVWFDLKSTKLEEDFSEFQKQVKSALTAAIDAGSKLSIKEGVIQNWMNLHDEAVERAESAGAALVNFRLACSKQDSEIQQILGKALGYPAFMDDQANFPGATEADGVAVGEHVAVTLAVEAAKALAEAQATLAGLGEVEKVWVSGKGFLTIRRVLDAGGAGK